MKTRNTQRLLEALHDGKLHSGETLAQSLGITRSAVWKIIQQLQSLGLNIESQHSLGYSLPGGLELLDEKQIKAELSPKNAEHLKELILLDSVESTNDYLLERVRQAFPCPMACLAEQQTRGRGRRGRSWFSPYGNNLYFSLAWHFDKDPSELMGLSLVAGLVIINSLNRYGLDKEVQVKWPNDVLWQGRKLAGVLTEVIAQSNDRCEIVLGIGINTQVPSSSAIDQPWVDLQEIMGFKIQRNRLAGILVDELISTLNHFETMGLNPFINPWKEHDFYKDLPLSFQYGKELIHGLSQGITEKGELLMLDNTGQLRAFSSGEILKPLA